MAKSQISFNKKELEKKKRKKKQDKEHKKEVRRSKSEKKSLDDMIAYVDENGKITSTPPDPDRKTEVNAEDIEVSVSKQEEVEYDPVRKGVVTFFNDAKGYGFIKDSETQESVFVHVNGLLDDIEKGSKVTFETEMGLKGINAVKVKLT
ncbi:cold shock domain-containing protein [Marinilabiliaceae bacterium ANBcel2]|nr:cold shock domain-containing protein [Marinilabiliaceae bacterium ANBcel2]